MTPAAELLPPRGFDESAFAAFLSAAQARAASRPAPAPEARPVAGGLGGHGRAMAGAVAPSHGASMGRWAADAARRYAPDADASQRSALIRRLQAAGATQGLPVLQAWATERATRPGAMRNPWAVLWHRFARLGVQLDRLPARGARP